MDIGKQLRDKLHLAIGHIDDKEPLDTTLPKFAWVRGVQESEQKTSYLAYLRQNLPPFVTEDTRIYVDDADVESNLLDICDDSLPFGLKGTADVVIVDECAKRFDRLLAGLRMVIMVRMNIKKRAPGPSVCSIGKCKYAYGVIGSAYGFEQYLAFLLVPG